MPKKYTKLTRQRMKALEPGSSICEHNIKFERRPSGDGMWTVYLNRGERVNRVVGYESEGMTLIKVEAIRDQMIADLTHDRFNLPKGRKNHRTFKHVAVDYQAKIIVEGGKNLDRKKLLLEKYLLPFFGDKAFNKITTFDVERFKAETKKKFEIKDATVNQSLAVRSHMQNKALEWGWIQYASFKVKKYKLNNARNEYLTAEQCKALLKAAYNDPDPYLYPFVLIALNTSMRRREILGIRLEDIDLERKAIFIPKAKAGARQQPITSQLVEFLRDYIPTVDQSQPWLFPSLGAKKSKSGHCESIERPFRRAVKAIGLDPSKIIRHTLRHTAITHLVQAGVDLPTVMQVSGHKSLQMVQRYAHQNGAHIEAAMEKLEGRYLGDKTTLKTIHLGHNRSL